LIYIGVSLMVTYNKAETFENLKKRGYIFLHALAFVFGFSLIFVIGWGGATTILGQLFVTYKDWIARIGGIVLIIFGLATMDLIHIPWFYMDTRRQFKGKTGTFWGSIAMGVFFAAGWSPCISATLGAILTLGFSSDTVVMQCFYLFGIPLVLAFHF
jgi:cytochrome c-type biogenesis protein